jgi:hypothetical protein
MNQSSDRNASFWPIIVLVLSFACLIGLVLKSRIAGTVFSLILLSLASLIMIGLHFWESNLDPFGTYVSEYSVDKRYGILMRMAFFLLASATFGVCILLTKIDSNYSLIGVVAGAGLFTMMMGFFSMRTTTPGEIHTSPIEGTVHGLSAGLSFGLAIFSMVLFAYWPPGGMVSGYEWTRAVALAQFHVAVVAMAAYVILGVAKIKTARKGTHLKFREMIRLDLKRNTAPLPPIEPGQQPADHARESDLIPDTAQQISPDLTARVSSLYRDETAKTESMRRVKPLPDPEKRVIATTNKGLGLTERILILLFLEWEFFLLCILFQMTPK